MTGTPRTPHPLRMAVEARALLDGAELLLRTPSLARVRKGDGHSVIVLPGFGASDMSTALLRRFLSSKGYDVQGWGLGTNHGRVIDLLPMVLHLVRTTAARSGRVSLVGWSLGGVLAREAARELPNQVRRVITMGTPVVGGPKYTQTARTFQARGVDLDHVERMIDERELRPITVPITAIYSHNDGVVDWRACIDRVTPGVEHIRVRATHLGMGASAEVFRIVAHRLAATPPAAGPAPRPAGTAPAGS
ncbi:MAG: alpha/beta hydrolase [Actinomycetota bacterium]|nr:alpha/beta hydrolase [Actinomycetota bacterium]